MKTRKLYEGLHKANLSQEYFIQDFYIPFERAKEFLQYTEQKLGIFPLWLCPIKSVTTPQKMSPHFSKSLLLIDVGIWGQARDLLKDPVRVNREFEQFARSICGRKMLYAHAYYTKDEFWKIYDKSWYDTIRNRYRADVVFPDIWEKVHVSQRREKSRFWTATLGLLASTILERFKTPR